jgi:ribonuclease HII
MELQNKSIKEIKAWLESIDYKPDEKQWEELQKDSRTGLKPLLERIMRKQAEERRLEERFREMSALEQKLWGEGICYIAGVDEVGRGPLAGPVVSAAVILPQSFYLPGINDSKQLTTQQREEYYDIIMANALSVGIGIIHSEVIDEINILNATKRAMLDAIANLTHPVDALLIDALNLETEIPQYSIIGGDAKSISIAAASIIAKVTRDRWMAEQARIYPQYGFDKHMGYGTKEHLLAIARYGITPIHRRSFTGVREWVEKEKVGS